MTDSPRWAQVWTILRLAIAGLIVAAVIGQLWLSITSAIDNARDVPTTIANFLSFFTILSNVGSAAVLVWAATWFWTNRRAEDTEPRGLALALTSVTTYMIITGVVYNTLLRGVALPQGTTLPWSNEVLHVVAPLFLLLDLFLGPLRRALPWRASLAVLLFPLAWVAYTFVRGPLTTNPATGAPYWYPYPFLDPNGPGGVPSAVFFTVLIAVGIIAVALLVVWVGRYRAGRRARLRPASVL
ncbi:Pr6Pr family membrane protein [Microbacterium sp. P01]|uniref:Pr6Pr family membrane protein n=1 Tax=unclassified Microbacterium TaxID=2609290 RepID=UPI0036715D02